MHIKPGYSPATLLLFPGKGHETVHRTVSDLYFQIQELPHPHYRRIGDDLIYTHFMSLIEALDCKSIEVPTLDGRHIKVGLDEIATYFIDHLARNLYKKYPDRVLSTKKQAKKEIFT